MHNRCRCNRCTTNTCTTYTQAVDLQQVYKQHVPNSYPTSRCPAVMKTVAAEYTQHISCGIPEMRKVTSFVLRGRASRSEDRSSSNVTLPQSIKVSVTSHCAVLSVLSTGVWVVYDTSRSLHPDQPPRLVKSTEMKLHEIQTSHQSALSLE